MQEVILKDNVCLMQIPKGEKMFGIVLPCTTAVNKDGVAILKQRDAVEANRLFHVGRALGQYTKEYGEHVFYLGTYRNPIGGQFRLFSFPVRRNDFEECDATMISRSCQDLTTMCDRYGIECCLLPDFVENYETFYNCFKSIFDLVLDSKFILVHRKG